MSGIVGVLVGAVYIVDPFPSVEDRATEAPAPKETPYPRHAIEEWEREAEAAVDLALLASPGVRDASRSIEERTLEVESGDTLMHLFLRAGVPRNQAAAAIEAMRKVYDPRRIRPGQKLTLAYLASDPAFEDRGISLRTAKLATAPATAIAIERRGSAFAARKVDVPTKTRLARTGGEISSSLYRAAEKQHLPIPVLLQLVRIFSWDVDFQREIRAGDSFDVAWETLHTSEGKLVDHGDMVYGSLTLRGKKLELYRFTARHGTDYFDRNGAGARKPLMRTPIDGARLSSRYGKRRHPILGYTKMHRGVDFAARSGTPIYAAGDGRVAYAGRNGSYGIYVRIRHNSRYQTAYAHMRALRRGIRRGANVRQGQVIGYVGSTGRSTGPHLHYEILVDGRQVNPLSVSMPPQIHLKGADLAAFEAYRGTLENRLANIKSKRFAALDGH
ncbi:MAG: peptidoglycan DD-metalloendopeptidase family protein [Defluviicoccus sp.]|nr:peptidoglycan DD-metalloendopeptidase family protein [Defluviicoccus sp.]MDE0386222.1 peptidoglycan DD-metalloendopeptidase family protein [Defluviicoccus sp.]